MSKILTISVAAYNVENYLEQCLQSCAIPEILDDIEVLIENDGSTDCTPEIAEKFQKQYPQTFRLINKENGGYGSTINRSVQEATGRYFKLLDGDDWFDQKGLTRLVQDLKLCDTDYFLTKYYNAYEDGSLELSNPKWPVFEKTVFAIDKLPRHLIISMWGLAVRTDILKKNGISMPEHTLYTDQLFVVSTLKYVKSITIDNYAVYCYRLGRDGQSVSTESRIKHYQDNLKVFWLLINVYRSLSSENEIARKMLITRIRVSYISIVRTLLLLPTSTDNKQLLMENDKKLMRLAPDISKDAFRESKRVKLLRLTGYHAYNFLSKRETNWN